MTEENERKITALENIISHELKKSDSDVDTDLIEECLDYAMELKSIESSEENISNICSYSFTEEELEAKAKTLLEKNNRSKKPSFMRTRSKVLIAAVCTIIFISAMTVISYSFDEEHVIHNYMPQILKLEKGESLIVGDMEFQKTTDNETYSDIYDLLEKESIESVLFPSVLENYTASYIRESIRNGFKSYRFSYKEGCNFYYSIDEIHPDSPDFAEEHANYDVITVNDIDYYYRQAPDIDNAFYIIFTDGRYEYWLNCDTYEIMIELINSIAVYNSAK